MRFPIRRPPGAFRSRQAWRLVLVVAFGIAVGVLAWLDIDSPSRANRLYRGGDGPEAIAIYRRIAETDSLSLAASYNLGTMWLSLGAPVQAEAHLRAGLTSPEPDIRFRSAYNLGLLLLDEGLKLSDREMAASLVGESLLAFRDALRMAPGSDDTRWNLAVAMVTLDSLAYQPLSGGDRIPTRRVPLELVRTRTAGSGEAGGSGESGEMLFGASVPGPGARELLASELEGGAFRMDDVDQALRSIVDDPRRLLDRMLGFEGPRGWFVNDTTAGPG